MALLEVRDLKTHIYTRRGIVKAVDEISFSVEEGETLGIVGESGCGKTMTSLSLLKLLPEPGGRIVGGQIIFEGEDLVPKSEAKMRKLRGSRISMILQEPMQSLNPSYTIGNQVSEAISIHQKIRGRSLRDRVVAALEMVKIPAAESRLRHYPHQMSGGIRQRVVGAIALSCEPALLIADEPTTALDVTIQAQYLNLLKEVQSEAGVAMIFITHDFGIVARMCDKVAVMYAGRIMEKANTRELFNNPRHPYTIALMGCVPRLEVADQKLENIPGQTPDLVDLPRACAFATRCSEVSETCRNQLPEEKQVADGHYVSCFRVQG